MTTEMNNDELVLKFRKIWSRWGKWSECSVTCGEGNISRRRHCVSGRCAPGEFEEQRRPCTRRACECSEIVDDLRDRD
ncbi:properdin-like [Vanessa atalanta]|uniref:properdin-like n=1 Tax=Vanessa atalanta TaxID=42275 RepID=UPI001FCD19B2|nr:properdin-like [Vanessa atalanta]